MNEQQPMTAEKRKAAEEFWRYNSETIRPISTMPNSPLHVFAGETAKDKE